jgi:Cu2+-exporting ATPase
VVIFDKTGTLTRGSPAVSGNVAVPGASESEVIAFAAAVEINSEHPLAKAIVEEAKHRGISQLRLCSIRFFTELLRVIEMQKGNCTSVVESS